MAILILFPFERVLAQEISWSKGREGTSLDPAIQPDYGAYDWPDDPPRDCPFEQSAELTRIRFTGRYANYTGADTFYPMWAADGNQYSCWTDGFIWTNRSFPWVECQYTNPGRNMDPINTWTEEYPPFPQLYHCHSNVPPTCIGIAKIVGDSPLNLDVINLGKLYSGNNLYPSISLVADDNFFIGTYDAYSKGGRFNGFRYSNDWDHWVEETEAQWENEFWKDARTPGTDFFAADTSPRRFNVPHAVVFGQNNELSPDGKAYFTAHGEIEGGKSNWDKGDAIYLCRVSPDPRAIIDPGSYEFFGGHDASGKAIWFSDLTRSKPILVWQNHLGSEGLTFIPALGKFILMTARLEENEDNLPYNVLIFWESDEITGPFKMVHYLRDWGPQTYFPNIPAKFISPDGRSMWLCVASNYSHPDPDPVQCRYGFSMHEIVLETPDFQWEEPEEKGINIAPLAVVTTDVQDHDPAPAGQGRQDEESKRWVSDTGAGSWIRLHWDEPRTIDKIRLWDLPETDSWILQGTFTFSDGTVEKLHAWTSNRALAASEISFKPKSVSWVKFTIDQASGTTLGLSRIEVYAPD